MGKFFPILALVLGSAYFFIMQDKFDPEAIRNKRVLVTGASSGIGEQLAYQYAKLGARLVLTARREKLLQDVYKNCKELGAKDVKIIPGDMANSKDRDLVVKETVKFLGGLDHLILNHAAMRLAPWQGTPENMTTLQTDFSINFVSYVDIASKLLPELTKSKGNIGVVSSVAGKMGNALGTTYVAGKFALQGFFSALRQELNHKKTGVSVTICVLGAIETDAAKELLLKVNPQFDFSIAASPVETADAIIVGVAARAYEVYHGKLAYWIVQVHKIIPHALEDYITRTYLKDYEF